MLEERAVLVMRTNRPVPIESRALGTLSYIRASIDAASAVAVPGTAGIVLGCVGTIAALLVSLPSLESHRLAVWLGAACVGLVLASTLMAKQAPLRGSALLSGPIRKFMLCLVPGLSAGGVLTFVLWRAELEHYIPAAWLLLYGCAVIPTSTVTTAMNLRIIAGMGAAFMALGVVTFWLPPSLHTVALGTGFGGFHVVAGLLVGRVNHGE